MLKYLLKDESAQGLTEFILIIPIIAIAVVVINKLFGTKLTRIVDSVK